LQDAREPGKVSGAGDEILLLRRSAVLAGACPQGRRVRMTTASDRL
jgi:hypothetical protein